MDPEEDPETDPSFSPVEHPALEQKPFLPSSPGQTEGGAPVLLQLLAFKTHLQEVLEELHIRRDAERRFEDEISKLALEKQELDWEKESLQHQIETVTKQHTESLGTVKKRFQAKLQHTKEEKGKYQVSAELKDKEINNLKEELKSLQLLKYNLEKKSSELEQKLALQSRTKESHLNQLAEVEKRFSALSKQCATVKQAHDKLEQNVDEAIKINSKLTSANQKQEGIIVALKKELEEVGNKLIKRNIKPVRDEKTQSPLGRERHLQELQQKLHMEIEVNKKLREENIAERAEKLKLMRSLQHNMQLMLSQTQTVRRIEQELENQTVTFQALKQEHEVMRENRKAMEDKVAELTESYAASKTSWDKEQETLQNQIKSAHLDLQATKEANEELQQKCLQLTLQASSQAQQTEIREMKDNGQSPLVERLFLVSYGIRAEESQKNPNCSSQPPDLDSLQHAVSSQPKIPYCLKDEGAASKLATAGASEDQDNLDPQQEMIEMISHIASSIPDNHEKATETSDTRELIGLTESCLTKSSCPSSSNTGCGSPNGSTEVVETYKHIIQVQTADEGSAKAAEKISSPETDTGDRGEGEVTDGVKERGQTAEHASGTPDTQIPASATADMTEASLAMQVNDFTDAEPPSTVCEPLSFTESVSQKATEKEGHLNNKFTVNTKEEKLTSDEHSTSITAEDVLCNFTGTVQTSCSETEAMNNQLIPLCQVPGDKESFGKALGVFPADCTSQTNLPLFAGEFNQSNYVHEFQTNQTERGRCNPSNVNANMIQKVNTCAPFTTKESELKREPQQELSEKNNVQLSSAVANDEKGVKQRRTSQPNENRRETEHILSSTSSLKDASVEVILLPDVSAENNQEDTKINTVTESGETEITPNQGVSKLSVLPSYKNNGSPEIDNLQLHKEPSKEKRPEASSDRAHVSKKSCRSLFDWRTTQMKTFSSRPKSGGSILQQLNQSVSGGDTTGYLQCTRPMFNKSRHDKVPLLVARASDLFSATSACGATSYLTAQQKESGEVKDDTSRVAESELNNKPSSSISCFPVTPSSNITSKLSWQTNRELSAAPSTSSVTGSESDWEATCSQDRDTEQSSFRDQIYKIEQFLSGESLRMSKK